MIAIGLLADEADRTQLRTIRWNPMATAQESRSYATQTRLRRGFPISPLVCGGFYDGNGEFVTADERVECRLGGRGTVNAIFQGGEAEVMFDDDADLSLVKWDHIWKLPSWAQKT